MYSVPSGAPTSAETVGISAATGDDGSAAAAATISTTTDAAPSMLSMCSGLVAPSTAVGSIEPTGGSTNVALIDVSTVLLVAAIVVELVRAPVRATTAS